MKKWGEQNEVKKVQEQNEKISVPEGNLTAENVDIDRRMNKPLATDKHHHVDKPSICDKPEMLDKEYLASMPRSPQQCIATMHGEIVDGKKIDKIITIDQETKHDKPHFDKPSKKVEQAEVTKCSLAHNVRAEKTCLQDWKRR